MRQGCEPEDGQCGDNIVPIPGTKRRHNLEENIAALDVSLSEAEIAAIEDAFPLRAVVGDRYNAEMMRILNNEARE